MHSWTIMNSHAGCASPNRRALARAKLYLFLRRGLTPRSTGAPPAWHAVGARLESER